jgi:hypothetical protein
VKVNPMRVFYLLLQQQLQKNCLQYLLVVETLVV